MSFDIFGGGKHLSICPEYQGDLGKFEHLGAFGSNDEHLGLFLGHLGGIYGCQNQLTWHL
jgi:hypothetical protein